MNSNDTICLKLGNKIIFQHHLSQLKKLEKMNNNRKPLNNDVTLKFSFDNKTDNEFSQKMNNEKNLLKKMVNGFLIPENKKNFREEISKAEFQMNNVQQKIEKNKLKDYEKFKEMISILKLKEININKYENLSNDSKKEIIKLISSKKKLYANILNLNKNNIDKFNEDLASYKNKGNNSKSINDMEDKDSNEDKEDNEETNKIEQNINMKNKVNRLTEENLENFKNFIGNSQLSNRMIISYFDIEHPNIKQAAKKYFISKYGSDEITLIYIYKNNPNNRSYRKFELISDISELFLVAKTENIKNPRLFLQTGKEIKYNRKIKCIGALNLDNNAIIKIM